MERDTEGGGGGRDLTIGLSDQGLPTLFQVPDGAVGGGGGGGRMRYMIRMCACKKGGETGETGEWAQCVSARREGRGR